MPNELNEAALIARILAGEQELYHELIRPYERLVYRTACSVLKNEGEAEDAAQEATIHAFRALRGFRGTARFSTWLVSITLNEARGRLRKMQRALTESIEESTSGATGDVTPALLTDWREVPLEALERRELTAEIERAIDELPVIYREVFVLRDREEMSIDEIAGVLQVTSNVVKVRLHRARMMLQKKLVPYLRSAVRPRRRWFPASGGSL